MARFARDRRLVEAIVDGVDALLHADGSYDSHDLINWLNANRTTQLNDLYDLYPDCADPEMTADQQLGKFLYRLGQIKIDEQVSPRSIDRRGGGNRNGTCAASVWEVSDRTTEGLETARKRLFGPEGFFERISREEVIEPRIDWINRISGSFIDDADFQEMVRLGREYRDADRPEDEDDS